MSSPQTSPTPDAGMQNIMDGGKPKCGGGEEVGEYDLGLHVAGLFLVLLFSILGAGFPVVAKKVSWVKVPTKVFFMCKHFGTGVLIATAFVHLLPTAFGNLMDPCLPDLFTTQYPAMPGVIMMGSMFVLFVIEMWLNSKTGGHSHGGPTGFDNHSHGGSNALAAAQAAHGAARPQHRRTNTEDTLYEDSSSNEDINYEKMMAQELYAEKVRRKAYAEAPPRNPFADRFDDDDHHYEQLSPRSEMPPWFIVFYEQYVRQRLELVNMIKATANRQEKMLLDNNNTSSSHIEDRRSLIPASIMDSPYRDVETGEPVHPLVYKKMSMNITLLEGGILFHSVFVGMTVSITIEGFTILLIAILFHQMFEGLGLGSRIAAVPYRQGSPRPWLLVVAFGTTAPIGQAIGLLARSSYDPNSAFGLIIVGIFNAISSGLLLYAALVDLLAEDFLSEEAQRIMTKKDKISAFIFVLLGGELSFFLRTLQWLLVFDVEDS
ncbi:Zinc/iron permease [Sordaria brevicollis]|uniref:Zinc/iron permease n=1 Tax=Sordaria brevicollis TaxID=83679 RepID=A0AAE0PLQ4_SORBR|nr:Zinc/iron permease [Sordaria brevicollis]